MAKNPFEKANAEFRRAMEKNTRCFRSKVQAVRKIMQTATDRESRDRAKVEMDLAKAELETGLARARETLQEKIELARAEYQQSGKWPMPRRNWPPKPPRPPRYRGAWPPDEPRRPRGGPAGGEPVPVEPRPKPKPLVDGAEAPIE